MAHISFYLPCEPFWHEGVYQLETSDFATGYNPVLGTDGPANRQWKELGDRTLFLKDILEAEHVNGRHRLKAGDFAQGEPIPEEKLKLDYGTSELALMISGLETDCARAYEILNLRNSQELSPAAILGRILPSLREYYDSGASIDLLGVTASLREFTATAILKEIAGDDSLDVESTRGIYPGNTYFLMDQDGGRVESATVLSVLTDHRIRFTASLSITRNAGLLSSANIPPEADGALIYRDFVYQSDWVDAVSGSKGGRLFVHRDAGQFGGKCWWQGKDGGGWKEAELVSRDSFYDGTCDDVFLLPGIPLRFRVEYPASETPWKLYWLALQAQRELVLPETVRRPQIESVEFSGKTIAVHGSPYASLWDLPQGGLEMRLGIKDSFTIPPQIFAVSGKSDGMSVTCKDEYLEKMPLTVSIRHSDIEGTKSRWSDIAVIGNGFGDE